MTAAAVQNVKHELWPRTCSLFCGCSAHSGHNTCQKTTMWETRKWVKIQLGVQTLNNSLPAAPRSEQQATRKVWSQTGSQQKEESNPVLNICVSLLQVCWPVDADSLPDFFFFFFSRGWGGVFSLTQLFLSVAFTSSPFLSKSCKSLIAKKAHFTEQIWRSGLFPVVVQLKSSYCAPVVTATLDFWLSSCSAFSKCMMIVVGSVRRFFPSLSRAIQTSKSK